MTVTPSAVSDLCTMLLLDFLQGHPAAALGAALAFGLLVGSFLNVVIYRLPVMIERDWRAQCEEIHDAETPPEQAQESPGVDKVSATDAQLARERFDLLVPRSRCPSCHTPIKAHQNIPVLSYALQRGRCAACGWGIPLRYPAVELLTGLLSVAVVAYFGPTLAALGALGMTYALVALTFIDFDTQLLPDAITLPLLWAGLALNLGEVYTTLAAAVIGAMAGYLSLWSIYWAFRLLTGKEGMGYGDFKLMAAVGAWLGWSVLPAVVLLSSVLGAVVGIALIVVRGHDRQVPIPFGPYIAAAGWLSLFLGDRLSSLYLGLGNP